MHTNPDAILAGKKLSSGDFGNSLWWYQYSNLGGIPLMACGYCHPNTSATHLNGVKNLNFDPNEVGLIPNTLKGKNNAEQIFTQNSGVSVTCSSVYCHSNGYDDGTGYTYQTSPEWYGGSFAGDKCANCHGNSPNSGGKAGSLSHYNPNSMGLGVVGGHFVGIHYKNVFTGTNGLIKDGSNRQNAHGAAATSTTINCNTCHQSTVSTSANDQNSVCSSCHANKGNMVINPGSTTHINGMPDVTFAADIRSRAQIRDDIISVAELNSSWIRYNAYKVDATSFDGSSATGSYNAGQKTCSSVSCHNGNTVTWGATNITCNSCHTSLP
jgi:predicted CxxxxCH...CXXCH cytochrome family protein